jgi:hypothetical protein
MMTMTAQHNDLIRLRTMLEQLQEKQEALASDSQDTPLVLFLTERMLQDIESCKRLCQSLHRRATWPSIN